MTVCKVLFVMNMVELLKGAMVCKTSKNKKDTKKAKKRQKRTTAIKQINKKKQQMNKEKNMESTNSL